MRRAMTGTFLAMGIAFLALVAWSGSARTGALQTTDVGVTASNSAVGPDVAPPVLPADEAGLPADAGTVSASGVPVVSTTGGLAVDSGREPIPPPGGSISMAQEAPDIPSFDSSPGGEVLPVPEPGTS